MIFISCFSYCLTFANSEAERILEELCDKFGDVVLYHIEDFKARLGEAFAEAPADDDEAFEEIFELIHDYEVTNL